MTKRHRRDDHPLNPPPQECQFFIRYPTPEYVQSLFSAEERLLKYGQVMFWMVGIADLEGGCGHFKVICKIDDVQRAMLPCFTSEAAADRWRAECQQVAMDLLQRDGRNPMKFGTN